MRRLPLLSSLSLLLGVSCAQDDVEVPTGPAIAYEPAFPAQAGFDRPLFVAFTATDPDSAYVVTQPGFVYRIPRDGQKADRAVFLDLSAKVFLDHFEEGLLGFQFDPDYAQNGFVYAYWTERIAVRKQTMPNGAQAGSNRQSVISRWSVRKDEQGLAVDPASELRLAEIFQPFGNHNGGTIVFGPDKMLYVGLGDGGAANDPYGNSQSKGTLLGKVLRIDVAGASKERPYTIPQDNPFVGEDGARGEIWCLGIRNPWRLAFDRETGDLWCGDVGQNRIEEVDRLVKGGNYGWNVMEASEVFALRKEKTPAPKDLIAPIAEYAHDKGQSITGGHVYRGKRIPGLVGRFVYADYMSMRAWAVREDRQGGKHEVVTLARVPGQPSSFAEELDGELLVTCFGGRNGRILRLVPAAK
jgi:quinoprotein glucose dehydrogenase